MGNLDASSEGAVLHIKVTGGAWVEIKTQLHSSLTSALVDVAIHEVSAIPEGDDPFALFRSMSTPLSCYTR